MGQENLDLVLALGPFSFKVHLVIRKWLVWVTDSQWGRAGWEKLLCPVYWDGSSKGEGSSAVQEEREHIGWFLDQNLHQSTPLFTPLCPKFEKPVVWRGKKGSGRQTSCVWGADVGWMLPPDL